MIPLLALTAALAVADAGIDPGAPTLTVRLDKNQGQVGDVFTLTVTAAGPRTTPVNLPATLDLAPFAILNRSENEKDPGGGRMVREFVLSVAAYEPGDLVIPAVEVTYLGKGGAVCTARTEPVPVKLTSLIANEPEPGLKENAPPVRVMQDNWLPVYIAGGLAAVALGAGLALFLRRRLRARLALRPEPPPRPPHEIALEKLDRLGVGGIAEDADLRTFYFALSEIIREYLGDRFLFDSLEMTTEELVVELRRRSPRALVLGEVEGWLSACDLVKFAKVAPTTSEARGALETAIRIASSTRPRAVVPSPEDPPAPTSEAARG